MGHKHGGRRKDWQPLTDSDPTPGNPEAIRDEVDRMREMARKLRGQSHNLKTISRGENIKGRYAKDLKDKAGKLEKRLREVAERYEHVAGKAKGQGPLRGWADELEDFQSRAEDLYHQAEREHKKAKKDGKHDHGKKLEAEYPDESTADDLLSPLLFDYHDRAQHYANKINSAISDIIEDSDWEKFKDGVSTVLNNKYVKKIFQAASIAATLIGVLSLFIPGLGEIALLALLVKGITYAIAAKDVLAMATGNGNWSDLAWDAIAVATMHTGKLPAKALEKIQGTTRAAAARSAASNARQGVRNGSRAAIKRANDVIKNPHASPEQVKTAQLLKRVNSMRVKEAGKSAHNAEVTREVPEVTRKQALRFGGNLKLTRHAHDIARTRELHSGSRIVQLVSAPVSRHENLATTNWALGSSTGLVPKVCGGVPPFWGGYDWYNNARDHTDSNLGSSY